MTGLKKFMQEIMKKSDNLVSNELGGEILANNYQDYSKVTHKNTINNSKAMPL